MSAPPCKWQGDPHNQSEPPATAELGLHPWQVEKGRKVGLVECGARFCTFKSVLAFSNKFVDLVSAGTVDGRRQLPILNSKSRSVERESWRC